MEVMAPVEAIMIFVFGLGLLVGMFKPQAVTPWKITAHGRRNVFLIYIYGALCSIFGLFSSLTDPKYNVVIWAVWIIVVYGCYRGNKNEKTVNDYISKIPGSAKRILKVRTKIGNVTMASDEQLGKTYIVRGVLGKVYSDEAEDFIPTTANAVGPYAIAVDNNRNKTGIIDNGFYMLNDFIPTEVCNVTGILLDSNRKKFCIPNAYKANAFIHTGFSYKVFTHKDIISAEIVEDEDSITKTQRKSQLAGVAVGGALLGGAGAIIGGLSGSKRTKAIVTKIELKLIVNDMEQPNYSISFLSKETKRGSSAHKAAMKLAEKWYGMFQVLINMADKEEKAENQQQANSPIPQNDTRMSMADELQKLITLRDTGAISTEEFDTLKNKIISA